jgi:hypothetical protein
MNLPQLQRIRWAVRATLALGVSASVAANVLHAQPNPVSRIISAWSPLALLLTIELISRVPVHHRALATARWMATAAIAGIAAWVSYWHMAAVAGRYGETGPSPFLLPFSVDGLIVVASVCLVELGGRIHATQETQPAAIADSVSERPATLSTVASAVPLGQPVDTPADTPAGTALPARRPRRTMPTATRVARARAKYPTATLGELAAKTGLSAKTISRYLKAMPPDTPGTAAA